MSSDHQLSPTVHYKTNALRESVDGVTISTPIPSNMASLTQSYGKFSSGSSHESNKEYDMYDATDLAFTSSTENTIRVEIAESMGEHGLNITTTTLRKCKKEVLLPYWRLLVFIGWRRFGHDSIHSNSCRWRFINLLYPTTVVLLLLYSYVFTTVFCQWKLNILIDTRVVTPATIGPSIGNTTQSVINRSTIPSDVNQSRSHNLDVFFMPGTTTTPHHTTTDSNPLSQGACRHMISTYVIPNICHLITYIFGFYYFRIQDNEQLYALMEKVFLQASPLQGMSASQQKVIFKLRLFLIVGVLWIIVTVAETLLFFWAYNIFDLALMQAAGAYTQKILVVIQVFGKLLENCVSVAVIMNFITQCEMIKFYVKGIVQRFQERAVDLTMTMKDIFVLRQHISTLNGPMAKMTTLITFINIEEVIIGMIMLCLNEINIPIVWISRTLFTMVSAFLLVVTLIQVAKTNSICRRFTKQALEARVFGYKTASQLDLDSFLLFVSSAHLKVRLFHVPFSTSILVVIFFIIISVIVILLQTDIIGNSI